jgi:NitT/TauT family transport system permease protein
MMEGKVDFAKGIDISIYRVTMGFVLLPVIALPLALMIGTFRPVQALLEPFADFIRYMPAVAFLPLVMLWVEIDESSKIAIIFIGTFFQMVLRMAEDMRRVPLVQNKRASVRRRKACSMVPTAVRLTKWCCCSKS